MTDKSQKYSVRLRVLSASIIALFFVGGSVALWGQFGGPHITSVVSAANYTPLVAPASLATIFGSGLATELLSARLNVDGSLPKELNGTVVEWNGKPVELIYASPNQINFVVPDSAEVGRASVVVKRGAISSAPYTIEARLIAPGLFLIDCGRPDRAAIQNGVTFELEPFNSTTTKNPHDDKRTRLSIYGTGIRYSGNSARDSQKSNVASSVKVEVTDSSGKTRELDVEFAGGSPIFTGLDQVNAIFPASLDDTGSLKICLIADGVRSNCGTFLSGRRLPVGSNTTGYQILRVAGMGTAGYRASDVTALETLLAAPTAIALGKDGSVYVADSGNRIVRKIGSNGQITTIAGSGVEGSSGDGGLAQVRHDFSRFDQFSIWG